MILRRMISALRISIHAPRAGGDSVEKAGEMNSLGISIHAPRAGGDADRAAASCCRCISIHAPRAGGDYFCLSALRWYSNFNPRPPCGGRRQNGVMSADDIRISIHAPRAGGDGASSILPTHTPTFQSTPPVRGATYKRCIPRSTLPNFNPRPPCGGRRTVPRRSLSLLHFNPRPPCGGRL